MPADDWVATPRQMSAVSGRAESLRSEFRSRFGELATTSDRFHNTLKQVFGSGYDAKLAEEYRHAALGGDFSWLPEVRLVDSQTLGGARGAFDASGGEILLNSDFSDTELSDVYMEEAGHFLDNALNHGLDTKGDEGEIFMHVLSGESLTAEQLAAAKAEDDHGVITVDGRKVEVEYGFFKSIKKAFKGIAKSFGGMFSGGFLKMLGFAIPGFGTLASFALSTAVDFASKKLGKKGGFLGKVLGMAGGLLSGGGGSILGSLGSVGGFAQKALSFLPSPIKSVFERGNDIFKTVKGTFRELGRDVLGSIVDGAKTAFGGITGGVKALAEGNFGE
ncbi:MAG: hypothetical protein ACOYN0_02700, partial [Phycisphaerales bacterium]